MGELNTNFDENCLSLKIPKSIYLRILGKALDQTHNDLDVLTRAIDDENFDQIQPIAHKLKGDYGNLRIVQLSAAAARMDELAKSKGEMRQLKEVSELFRKLFSELESKISLEQTNQ